MSRSCRGRFRVLMLALVACMAVPVFGQEWTRFRGPNGAGLSDATTVPPAITEADYNWKIQLPGDGHSSPAIWGDRIFLLCSDSETARRIVVCIHAADGRVVWKKSYDSSPYRQHRFNAFASATPAVDEQSVYVTWITPERNLLVALDHDGEERWQYDLGPFKSEHGGGASPIVHGDLVILANDQQGDSYLLAVDRHTGKLKWKVPRTSTRATYTTPCVYQDATGKSLLIFNAHSHGITAVDPADGSVVWEMKDLFKQRVIASPVIAADLIFGSCGAGGGGSELVALRPGTFDDPVKPEVAYHLKRAVAYVPTPVAFGPWLFVVSDGGVATCIEAATGEVVWRERLGGNYFASPICINGIIYCLSRDGELTTFRAAEQFDVIGRHDFDETSHATPAVAGGRLYIRTLKHLISIGGKAGG